MTRIHPLSIAAALALAASVAAPTETRAAFDWNADVEAPSIQVAEAPSKAALKCQKRIGSEAAKYLKRIVKAQSKCFASKRVSPEECLTAKDNEKIQKALDKAAEKFAKDCDTSLVAADALPNIWTSTPLHGSAEDIASCVLGQTHAIGEVVAGNNQGIVLQLGIESKPRDKCIKRVAKEGEKVASSTVKTIARCLDYHLKRGETADLGPICFGTVSGGTWTAPTHTKTAEKFQKIFDKAEELIAKDCDAVESAGLIESLPACSGSETVADLHSCAIGESYGYGVDVAAVAYAESATVLTNTDSVQDAADAAPDGTKFLLLSGDYRQSVFLDRGNLNFTGCGSALDDRPRFLPENPGDANGFNATSAPPQLPLENLTFQSLAFGADDDAWAENGIFVSGSDNLHMRDIAGEGDRESVYLVYPVKSTNVLVETSDAHSTTDAGIYVGQTVDCEVRFNKAWDHPASIEIENSGYCDVHNNIAVENSGGLLVFKLTGPDLQISRNHDIHHNYVANNNIPNHCHGGSICDVPPGTGLMGISDRFSTYRHNEIRDNKSVGFLMIDQETINVFVAAGSYDPTSDPQALEGNCFRNNYIYNNGYDADSGIPAGLEGAALVLPLGPKTDPAFVNGWKDNITLLPDFTPGASLASECADPAIFPGRETLPDPLFPSVSGAFVDGPLLY